MTRKSLSEDAWNTLLPRFARSVSAVLLTPRTHETMLIVYNSKSFLSGWS
jgi:hypothetical protein